jgi:D-sedoheptulose 7-phosphate isomerase
VALVGYDGGRLKKAAQHCVHVDVADMQIVEDVHMIMDHLTMKILNAQAVHE